MAEWLKLLISYLDTPLSICPVTCQKTNFYFEIGCSKLDVQHFSLGIILLSNFILSQILIGIAICVDILSFQFKERINILACLVASTLLISSHFMLLGHWTAAFLGLLAVARYASSMFTTSRSVMWLFLIVIFTISVFSFEGHLSVLSCVATVFTTIAAFCKDDRRLRQLMLIGTMIWIVHNYLAGSPGAVLMEAIFTVSNLVGYFRYYIRPKTKSYTHRN